MRKRSPSSLTTSQPLPKHSDTANCRGTLKYGAKPSRFFRKAKVLDDTHCKTKDSTNGKIPAAPEGGYILWEENPPCQPTHRGSAQASTRSNNAEPPRDETTRDKKWTSAWPWMNLRYVHIIITSIYNLSKSCKHIHTYINHDNTITHHAVHPLENIANINRSNKLELQTPTNLPW